MGGGRFTADNVTVSDPVTELPNEENYNDNSEDYEILKMKGSK
jgi:hypothetical protein